MRIWKESWVSDLRNPWLQSPPAGGLEEATMNSLKNTTGTGWDDDILLDHFNNRDQMLIKQVPVSLNQPQDRWKWVHNLKGIYTVKCGHYHLSSTQPSSPFNTKCAGLRKLWSSPISPKAKNLMWRVYMGLLPTMKSLVEKRVEEDSSCPSYHDGMEDTLHTLVTCRVAQTSRNTSLRGQGQYGTVTFAAWWDKLASVCTSDQLQWCAMMCWLLWNGRNAWVWKKHIQDYILIYSTAMNILKEWQQAQPQSLPLQRPMVEAGDRKWKPLTAGFTKCNVDGATIIHAPHVGFGFMIRNEDGGLVAARNGRLDGLANGLIAEALRCREALVWIQRNGLHNVTIESDSLVLVSQINKGSIYNSNVWLIIDDCRSLIRSLSDCDIVHVRCSVSHCLAKVLFLGLKWVNGGALLPSSIIYMAQDLII